MILIDEIGLLSLLRRISLLFVRATFCCAPSPKCWASLSDCLGNLMREKVREKLRISSVWSVNIWQVLKGYCWAIGNCCLTNIGNHEKLSESEFQIEVQSLDVHLDSRHLILESRTLRRVCTYFLSYRTNSTDDRRPESSRSEGKKMINVIIKISRDFQAPPT